MEHFSFGDTKIEYGLQVTYDCEGQAFSADETDKNIKIERQTEQIAPYLIKTRLKITNLSREQIFLKEAIPVLSEKIVLKVRNNLLEIVGNELTIAQLNNILLNNT